jgi:hypothetical protein
VADETAPAPTAPGAGLNRVVAAELVSNFGSMLSRLTIPWISDPTVDRCRQSPERRTHIKCLSCKANPFGDYRNFRLREGRRGRGGAICEAAALEGAGGPRYRVPLLRNMDQGRRAVAHGHRCP